MAASKAKPLFFVHTIDPVLWVYLMVFIRPFFRIVCFQYRDVKEIGFQRLRISSLSAQEFEDCNIAGLEFAKKNDFAKMCAIRGKVTDRELDFTNYFAKEILRSYTDLLLSGQMIRKLPDPHGVFILTRQFFGRELRDKVADSITRASGLHYVRTLWTIFRWLQIPLRVILSFLNFWATVAGILLKKKKTPRISLDGKIIGVANNVSDLQTDFIKQLSAGFIIDGEKIKKDDVLFLARRGPESREWRKQGFCVHNVIDLAGPSVHALTILRLLMMFVTQPRLSVGLIVFFPPWVMYYLVLTDILVSRHRFCGLIYMNSDVTIEPIFSVPFLARNIPVILFYYSASTFSHSMWAYLQADHIFVWNKGMVKFLKSHPQGQNGEKTYYLSGPLMQVEDHFSEQAIQKIREELHIPYDPAKKINLGIFDIATIKTEFLEHMRFVQNPKLTRSVHRDFLFDIFALAGSSGDVNMMIKPKRWTSKHDLSPDIGDYLERNKDQMILLPSSLNPQIAIQSCQVVICFPFTSIFFAAVQKGIPAVFYYPFPDEGLKKVKELQPFTIYGQAHLKQWFADYRAGRVKCPTSQEIEALCGIPLRMPIRERFITQLKDILVL